MLILLQDCLARDQHIRVGDLPDLHHTAGRHLLPPGRPAAHHHCGRVGCGRGTPTTAGRHFGARVHHPRQPGGGQHRGQQRHPGPAQLPLDHGLQHESKQLLIGSRHRCCRHWKMHSCSISVRRDQCARANVCSQLSVNTSYNNSKVNFLGITNIKFSVNLHKRTTRKITKCNGLQFFCYTLVAPILLPFVKAIRSGQTNWKCLSIKLKSLAQNQDEYRYRAILTFFYNYDLIQIVFFDYVICTYIFLKGQKMCYIRINKYHYVDVFYSYF